MTDDPLVSCIMPTRDRPQFVGQAIWYFLRQTYPQKELVVVDDGNGSDCVAGLIPDDPRIRYIHSDSATTTGAKRNIACEVATGELIAFWDDDDWMAPNRLAAQVAQLRSTDAAVCLIDDPIFFRLHEGQALRYGSHRDGNPSVSHGTMMFHRDVWQRNRFPDLRCNEDGQFISGVDPGKITFLDDRSLYVVLVHQNNTTARNFRDSRWVTHSIDDLGRLLDDDAFFYSSLRARRFDVPPPLPPKAVTPITVAGTFVVYDGYGSMAEYLVRGMSRAGVVVNAVPLHHDPNGMSSELKDILAASSTQISDTVLCHAWWGENIDRFRRSRDFFLKTVWETSRLPADWPRRLNDCRAVIVPSRFAAEVFRESGVTAPIEVAYEGVDPDVYHLEDRPERTGMTTLIVGVLVPRKNIMEGIAAWKIAFHGDPDARLIIKSRFQWQPFVPDDSRIQFIDTNETTRGIVGWYQKADVLMSLGNEGFGLPLIEGMATGLPVVALRAGAQTEVCEDAAGCVLPVEPERWIAVDEPPYGACGVRAVPSVEDAARQLRWVADHPVEARAMGRAASSWALAHRNVWDMGPAVVDIIERYSRPANPYRRLATVWVPGGKPLCEGRLLADAMAELMPRLRVRDIPSEPIHAQVLHVLIQEGLLDDLTITRWCQRYRSCGVPVVITELSVGAHARAWEREADMLCAFTAAGADRLRARWPRKAIAVLPVGVPPWHPPRALSNAAGRVVALVGATGNDPLLKGLAAVLRPLDGAQLLLIGAADHEVIPDLREVAPELAVEAVTHLRSAQDMANELADRADAVVVLGSDPDALPLGYTVRVCVSSGVPVVVRPADHLAELTDATYQASDLVAGLSDVLQNTGLRARLAVAGQRYCRDNAWRQRASIIHDTWSSILDTRHEGG